MVARRFDQVSEFGKIFDPTADRLLFIVAIVAIMIDGSAPLWFCVAVLVREVAFGGTVALLTLVAGMERFDVTYLGKWATFILMFTFPGFVMGESSLGIAEAFTVGHMDHRPHRSDPQLHHGFSIHSRDPSKPRPLIRLHQKAG